MPINKDLNVSPYFDDYDENKNFYQILFKPSVAVQVRELNQLQTILQAQVEKFGNNIYKRGTIIDGVNFIYYPNYAYIKIKDALLDGDPATPSAYISNFIVDPSSNLTAHIINATDGFEAIDPDLKTLYVRYINSSSDGNTIAFSSGSNLKIYDYLDSIDSVLINNGSSGFANSDTVVFCSALSVNVTSNTPFVVGETITNAGTTNYAIINGISVNGANTVLQIRPRQVDLSNTAVSSLIWTFTNNDTLIGSTSGSTATINDTLGSGATATITTTADIGKIVSIEVNYGGSGYSVAPYTTIKSSGATATVGSRNYTDLNLLARNYIAQVTVASTINAVGFGYAFGVTQGVIYQKGHFVRVDPQTIIVDKYNPLPTNLSVGFDTTEEIIDSNMDQSLLDQSTGTYNQFAPGADRLKLSPVLVVLDTDTALANEEFLSLADFNNGQPYRENRTTQFNSIETEMAQRTKESSGDYVLDEFLVTTISTSNAALEGQELTVVVDPGEGYIGGYRVETKKNFQIDVDKGTDGKTLTGMSATIDYGNFVYVTEVAGIWDCNIGTTINLMNSAQHGISNSTMVSAGTLSTTGSAIGTARVRNIVYDSGETGTNGAIYRLYLFNVQMNPGQSFGNVLGYQIGSTFGLADAIQEYQPTTNANATVLHTVSSGAGLMVDTSSDATRNISQLNYVYRQTNESVSMANNGTGSFLLTDPTETFGYVSTTLSLQEMKSVILVPTSNNIVFTPNTSADGTAAVTNTSNTITISAAAANKYLIGDWMALFSNSTFYELHRVTNKTSSGVVSFAYPMGFTNATATFAHAYPKNVPIGLHRISGATAVTTGGDKNLNINLANTINSATAITCSLTYDVSVTNAVPQSKSASRNNFVKIDVTPATTNGPWCLGIPDIFRLKAVYLGANSSVDTTATNVTDQFYIDHNQTADYYGLGYLYLNTDANITLTGSSWLLVQFDAFTSSAGVYTLNSYVSSNITQRLSDDSLDLGSLGTKTNSFEVPEVHTNDGTYYDLLNTIDFRPIVANTAVYANTAAAATVNPSATMTFSGTTKKFPLPESGVSFNMEVFLGRTDLVVVNKDSQIKIVSGTPSQTPFPPNVPKGVLLLNKLDIPPYPCVPEKYSPTLFAILNKQMVNGKYLLQRIASRTVSVELDNAQIAIAQPKGYTMAAIGDLERRIQNLEYEVALNAVESDLTNQVIPSNASPGLNRFKFGFFVDNYSTTNYSDTNNVEYRVDVVDSKVVPLSASVGIGHGPKNPSTGACVNNFIIINQNQASQPAPPTPPVIVANTTVITPNTVQTNTVASNTVVSTPNTTPIAVPVTSVVTVQFYIDNIIAGGVANYVSPWLTFSSVPGTWKLHMWSLDSDEVIIEKRNSAGVVSQLGYYNRDPALKLTTIDATHNPSTGRDYRIRINRRTQNWQFEIDYPIDNTIWVDPRAPSANVGTIFYDGMLSRITPGTVTPEAMHQDFGEMAYCALGIKQSIIMTGLKPGTVHNVLVGGTATNINTAPPLGGSSYLAANQVKTDVNGQLAFDITIDNSVIANIDALVGKSTTTVPSIIYVTVESADYTSLAGFIINLETGNPTANVSHNITTLLTANSLAQGYGGNLLVPPGQGGVVINDAPLTNIIDPTDLYDIRYSIYKGLVITP